MGRDFSELDLQLVIYDFNDTEDERDDNLIAGVAICAEDAAAFAADVEKLAVEKYGGATFSDLLEDDVDDESMAAACRLKDAKRSADLVAEAERTMAAGMPKETRRRPRPSIKGKTFEQIEEEYARARKRWEELLANPDGYSLDEFHERLLDYSDTGICADMAMRRHFESLDPEAQSEMLKLLAADERVSVSYWFDVLFGNWPSSEE